MTISVLRSPAAARFAGLAMAAPAAVAADWSLAEFCWSTWLAGLLFAWLCVITGGLQIVLTASRRTPRVVERIPALAGLSRPLVTAGVALGAALLAAALFHVYSFMFGFYGLFLSFFAEMEPHTLFGRNGFINSDFWTPVGYLVASFWAMSLGTVVAFGRGIARSDPWKRMVLPFEREIVRVHIMVVAMPFLALIAWAALGESYQTPVIVALMAVFYLVPARSRRSNEQHNAAPQPVGLTG